MAGPTALLETGSQLRLASIWQPLESQPALPGIFIMNDDKILIKSLNMSFKEAVDEFYALTRADVAR